ncbi:hypothetical protein BD413DRAFT_46618 [Trametes elegans]|nr:hypothetical protein BD413DRAFT_46618 [Trametes elegans]
MRTGGRATVYRGSRPADLERKCWMSAVDLGLPVRGQLRSRTGHMGGAHWAKNHLRETLWSRAADITNPAGATGTAAGVMRPPARKQRADRSVAEACASVRSSVDSGSWCSAFNSELWRSGYMGPRLHYTCLVPLPRRKRFPLGPLPVLRSGAVPAMLSAEIWIPRTVQGRC